MTGAIISLGIILVFIFIWWRYGSKHDVKSHNHLSGDEKKILSENVEFYQRLNAGEKSDFEKAVADFLSQMNFEWIGTDENQLDKILVAASAVIPIFHFGAWRYHHLTNILIYPGTFNDHFDYEKGERNILGMVGNGYMNGQMVLSQQALRQGFSNTHGARNTGIHEFVHLLDMEDGAVDGIPESLLENRYILSWTDLMHKEIQKITAGHSDINPYGATNEKEFLAVVAEYFFEKPQQLRQHHPELFELLEKIFNQQPGKS